jgi:hypothetical protein
MRLILNLIPSKKIKFTTGILTVAIMDAVNFNEDISYDKCGQYCSTGDPFLQKGDEL